MHWRRSGGREGIEPVPEDIDEGLMAIRIAEILNVPAISVPTLPPLWIRNAMVRMKVDALQHERAVKKAQQKRKAAAQPRAKRR